MRKQNEGKGLPQLSRPEQPPHAKRVYLLSNPPTEAQIEALVAALAPNVPIMKALMHQQDTNRNTRHPQDSVSPTPRQSA